MLVFNIIMLVCFVPIWPIAYFMTRNNAKPKKNIILGTTLPFEVHGDARVAEICRDFRKKLNIFMFALLPLFVPPFLMNSMGLALIWYMTLILFLILAPSAVFAYCRSKLMALKRENGWGSAVSGQRLADIKAAGIPVFKINEIWFFLAFLTSLAPAAYDFISGNEAESGQVIGYAIFASTILVFWVVYHIIYHLRTEVFSEDLTLTMALTRVRRYNWGKFWIVSAWLTAALNLAVWALYDSVYGYLAAMLIYSLVIIAFSLYVEMSTRVALQKLTAADPGEVYADEDDYWLLGIFYYNPNDVHLMVNDRVGINMTMNLARPVGKALMVVAGLVIAATPFVGVWMYAEERTPTQLVLSETELVARHTRELYVIGLSDIESVELIDELPSKMARTYGTAMENLAKGRYSAQGYGTVNVCIQPQNPPFLVITAGSGTYILCDSDSAVTRAVYSAIWGQSPN